MFQSYGLSCLPYSALGGGEGVERGEWSDGLDSYLSHDITIHLLLLATLRSSLPYSALKGGGGGGYKVVNGLMGWTPIRAMT